MQELETRTINVSGNERQDFEIPYKQNVTITGSVEGHNSVFTSDKASIIIREMLTGATIFSKSKTGTGKRNINEERVLNAGKYIIVSNETNKFSRARAKLKFQYPVRKTVKENTITNVDINPEEKESEVSIPKNEDVDSDKYKTTLQQISDSLDPDRSINPLWVGTGVLIALYFWKKKGG